MIDFVKAHPVFTVFCLIVGFYAIAFMLCLLRCAKDPALMIPETKKEDENEDSTIQLYRHRETPCISLAFSAAAHKETTTKQPVD